MKLNANFGVFFWSLLKYILPRVEGCLCLPPAWFLGLSLTFLILSFHVILCLRVLGPLTLNKISREDSFFESYNGFNLIWLGCKCVATCISETLLTFNERNSEYVVFLSKMFYIPQYIFISQLLCLLCYTWLILCYAYCKGEQLLGELQVKKRKH